MRKRGRVGARVAKHVRALKRLEAKQSSWRPLTRAGHTFWQKKIRCARPVSQGVSPLSGRTSPRLPVHWLCGPPLACAADWPLCRVALVSYFLGLCKSRNWFLSFFLRRRKQIGCHNTSCQIARYLTFCTTVYVTNTHNRIYGKVWAAIEKVKWPRFARSLVCALAVCTLYIPPTTLPLLLLFRSRTVVFPCF